jgi:NADH dehydrogenase
MAIYTYQKHPSAILPDEVDMPEAVITVFGGTGFLGSAIVRTLLQQGARVRIAARRPERLHPSEHPERLTTLRDDITDVASVSAALD